jgi:PAS domain-containing protein
MEAVGKIYDAHCAFLVLFPQNNAKLTPSHYWCAEASASPESTPVDFNTIAEVIKSGKAYNVTDIENRQNGANPENEAIGTGSIKSVIAVPLISHKTVISFTGLMTTGKQRTWPDDINVLMQMAGQIFTNVLDRRNSEHALRDSEQKYRSLLENIQEGIISVNSTGAIEFINERAANMLGYKVEEMIGASLLTFMYRENIKNATTQLRQRQQG